MRVKILGCGDAFGSGQRLQTAFLVEARESVALIDCGATTLVGLRREGIDSNAIDEVLLTHLHGDHFGGVPFLLLELHYLIRRQRPLRIVGPPGLEDRLGQAMATFYPGSAELEVDFPLELVEIGPGESLDVGVGHLAAWPARHPSGAPALSLRLEADAVLAVSGDTEWTPGLPEASRGADLFFCECFGLRPGVPYHLDLETLKDRRTELDCRRILLTHLGPEASGRPELFAEAGFELAEDGDEIRL